MPLCVTVNSAFTVMEPLSICTASYSAATEGYDSAAFFVTVTAPPNVAFPCTQTAAPAPVCVTLNVPSATSVPPCTNTPLNSAFPLVRRQSLSDSEVIATSVPFPNVTFPPLTYSAVERAEFMVSAPLVSVKLFAALPSPSLHTATPTPFVVTFTLPARVMPPFSAATAVESSTEASLPFIFISSDTVSVSPPPS